MKKKATKSTKTKSTKGRFQWSVTSVARKNPVGKLPCATASSGK